MAYPCADWKIRSPVAQYHRLVRLLSRQQVLLFPEGHKSMKCLHKNNDEVLGVMAQSSELPTDQPGGYGSRKKPCFQPGSGLSVHPLQPRHRDRGNGRKNKLRILNVNQVGHLAIEFLFLGQHLLEDFLVHLSRAGFLEPLGPPEFVRYPELGNPSNFHIGLKVFPDLIFSD